MQAGLTDIHGKNFCSAGLKQTIGETAGGRAEINRGETSDIELEMFSACSIFVRRG